MLHPQVEALQADSTAGGSSPEPTPQLPAVAPISAPGLSKAALREQQAAGAKRGKRDAGVDAHPRGAPGKEVPGAAVRPAARGALPAKRDDGTDAPPRAAPEDQVLGPAAAGTAVGSQRAKRDAGGAQRAEREAGADASLLAAAGKESPGPAAMVAAGAQRAERDADAGTPPRPGPEEEAPGAVAGAAAEAERAQCDAGAGTPQRSAPRGSPQARSSPKVWLSWEQATKKAFERNSCAGFWDCTAAAPAAAAGMSYLYLPPVVHSDPLSIVKFCGVRG